jgi:ParB/RepB/Spo0J family partition protein
MTASLVVSDPPKTNWREQVTKAKIALAQGREVEGGINPHQADSSPHQPRKFFGVESLNRLGTSLEEFGQIYPGIVRRIKRRPQKPFEILDGERRWRAAKSKNLRYRVILIEIDDEAAAFLIAAIANLNRENHTAIEISDSIVGMLKLDIPMQDIADMLGISLMWANQLHGLYNLHPKVRAMLDPALKREEMLPVTAAIQIAKADQSVQIELATRLRKGKVTIKGLRSEVVSVSKKAGVHIRVREVQPREKWKSVRALAGQVLRVSQDVEGLLGTDLTKGAAQNRSSSEIREVIKQFDKASELLTKTSKLLQSVVK